MEGAERERGERQREKRGGKRESEEGEGADRGTDKQRERERGRETDRQIDKQRVEVYVFSHPTTDRPYQLTTPMKPDNLLVDSTMWGIRMTGLSKIKCRLRSR